MSKFNIGDKVISKGYPYCDDEVGVVVGIDIREEVIGGEYLVKFDSLSKSGGWKYKGLCDNRNYVIEPYEGYAQWVDEDNLIKVEEECEEVCMSEFNIGDKVIVKDGSYFSEYFGEEVGIVVGIDTREDVCDGKYLVKFDSLNKNEGREYKVSNNNLNCIIKPYEGYAIWLDDLEKVEDEYEEECEEDKHEEYIRVEFDKVREQKKELIRGISGKILEMTLEIKELEVEIEKIKKEWHLD